MLLVAVLIPAISLLLDCLLHLAMGTPNLMRGMLAGTLVSAVTSLFGLVQHAARHAAGRPDGNELCLRPLPSAAIGAPISARTAPPDVAAQQAFICRAGDLSVAIKTLHLTNAWSETSGGIAVFYRALLEAGNRRRQLVRLVVPADQDGVEEAGEFGRIYHLKARRACLNAKYRMIYPNQFLFAGSKIQQILATERPELVEINDKYTLNYLGPILRLGLTKALDYRPVVVGLTCERMDRNFEVYIGKSTLAQRFCRAYMRWLYFPFFDHHIAISKNTLDELREAAVGHIVPRGIWTLSMGVDQQCFSPAHRTPAARRLLNERDGGSGSSVLLLYVGRLSPEKNLPLLLDTMESLKDDPVDYRLMLIGDGISRSTLEDEACRRLPGRVTFFGSYLRARYFGANLCQLRFFPPPKCQRTLWHRAVGRNGLRAGTGSSGYGRSNGLRQLAECLPGAAQSRCLCRYDPQVVNHSELRQSLSACARRTAGTFAWESITDSYLQLYDRLWQVGNGTLAAGSGGVLLIHPARRYA